MRSVLGAGDVLIGVDDTDNLESRGTGFLARRLLAALEAAGFGRGRSVTRHQLLVDPGIPYTSHNSSACIAFDGGTAADTGAIAAFCGGFLESESAAGSDPGLVVGARVACLSVGVGDALVGFGRRAKSEIVDQVAARSLAAAAGVHASGHGGDEGGVIGALAAVGLHLSGEDGRFLWMPGLRDLGGTSTYAMLKATVPIERARDDQGREPSAEDMIVLGDWVRPVLSAGQAVLLVERVAGSGPRWAVSARDVVKSH